MNLCEPNCKELICSKCGAMYSGDAREEMIKQYFEMKRKEKKPKMRINSQGGRELKPLGVYPKRRPEKPHKDNLHCKCKYCVEWRDLWKPKKVKK